jgi:WD40 repeat protein
LIWHNLPSDKSLGYFHPVPTGQEKCPDVSRGRLLNYAVLVTNHFPAMWTKYLGPGTGKLNQGKANEVTNQLPAKPRYDAFISYSRQNETFANKLEEALESYKPPKDLAVPQHHLNVFRDKNDFTAGEYYQKLDAVLTDSECLIVICSPEARASKYVNDEIRRFAQKKGSQRIIPVLFSGIPNNEIKSGQEKEMAFPEALCDVLQMPLAVNYLGFDLRKNKIDKGIFSESWFSTLAELYGVSRAVIEQREKQRQARARKIKAVFAGAVFIALSIALIIALISRAQALKAQQAEIVQRGKAEDSALLANKRRLEAELQTCIADGARVREEIQRRKAEASTIEANRQRDLAEERLRLAENRRYVSSMNLARGDFDTGNKARGYELLDSFLPSYSQHQAFDFRSFYWRFLWKQTHKEKHTFEGHSGWVLSVAFSSDGRILASASNDGMIKLWDVAAQKELGTLRGHTGGTFSLAFRPASNLLASAGMDRVIRLWDVETKQELTPPMGHAGPIYSVAFNNSGTIIASAGNDGLVKLWDVATHKELAALPGHPGAAMAVTFSYDGLMLVSAGADTTVKLWDVATRTKLATFEGHTEAVKSLAISRNNHLLASAGNDGKVKLWDLQTKKELPALNLSDSSFPVHRVAFSSDGQILAGISGIRNDTLKLWRVDNSQELLTLKGHTDAVWSIAFSNDGLTLASGSSDRKVKLWNVASFQELITIQARQGSVQSIAFNRAGTLLASGGVNDTAKIWSTVNHQELAPPLKGQGGIIHSVAFSDDGHLLATAHGDFYFRDNVIRLWDATTFKELATLKGHTNQVKSVAFSKNGRMLASGSSDHTIKLWDVASRKELITLKGHTNGIYSVAFSRNGQLLASASADHTVKLWDLTSRKELATLKGHNEAVFSVAFRPDGRTLASAGDNTIRLWDVATHQELTVLKGHNWTVVSVAFSPDGQTLASSGWDRTVKLWDVGTTQELVTFNHPAALVNCVTFSNDGLMLASANGDGTMNWYFGATDSEVGGTAMRSLTRRKSAKR